jgi:hypothetical protein
MSVDLRNAAGDEFSISTIGWAFYLNLASLGYGWQEAGTRAPVGWPQEEGPWTGAYDWNAGQIVSNEDARSFAAALRQYLEDPKRKENAAALAVDLGRAIGCEVTLEEDDADLVRRLIAFAGKGEFEIW